MENGANERRVLYVRMDFSAIAGGSIVWSLGNPCFKDANAKTYTENPRKVDENTARANF